jgi:tetratricopeptide (TPR) repeat protein
MAIAYSKTGRIDEAIRCYRRALEIDPASSGSHYGVAFLLLRRGDRRAAAYHLQEFLRQPPSGPEADRWVKHAQQTLDELSTADDVPTADPDGTER